MAANTQQTWMSASTELALQGLDDTIRKYQDPHEADSIMKIQKDLDETKIILHKTIDGVLERGVKLDNLVEKSTDLSAQSKMYVTCPSFISSLPVYEHMSLTPNACMQFSCVFSVLRFNPSGSTR